MKKTMKIEEEITRVRKAEIIREILDLLATGADAMLDVGEKQNTDLPVLEYILLPMAELAKMKGDQKSLIKSLKKVLKYLEKKNVKSK